MYEIIVKGDTYIAKSDEVPDENYDHTKVDINNLKGIVFENEFVKYIDYCKESYVGKLIGSFCEFDVENNKLFVLTTYIADNKLTEDELEQLKDDTAGQWSDGIGEGFEQHIYRGAYISMFHREKSITIE